MTLILILVFLASSILTFYILFEVSIIPIFIIIAGWGYQPERLPASYALFFYTITCSAPLLVVVIFFVAVTKNDFIIYSCLRGGASLVGTLLGLLICLGFLVKLPLYGLHLWLPKAHVEAPVFGSIILAGALLKLGGLGILRLNVLFWEVRLINAIISLRAIRLVFVGVVCLITADIKVVIAYSSVAHIALIIPGGLMPTEFGVSSSIFIMLTHAFSSSALFYGAFVIYLRSRSRNILLNKGLIRAAPWFSLMWILALMAGMGAPPTINLFSEIACIGVLRNLIPHTFFWVIIGVLLRGGYSLILFSSSQQGVPAWEIASALGTKRHEFLVMLGHLQLRGLGIFLMDFLFYKNIFGDFTKLVSFRSYSFGAGVGS
jgi:NADH-ubiquinone oxidoreductase chain 4